MEEKQPAKRDDTFYYTRLYYWKSEQALLSGSGEGTEMENMSASSKGIVASTSITSLYLHDPLS